MYRFFSNAYCAPSLSKFGTEHKSSFWSSLAAKQWKVWSLKKTSAAQTSHSPVLFLQLSCMTEKIINNADDNENNFQFWRPSTAGPSFLSIAEQHRNHEMLNPPLRAWFPILQIELHQLLLDADVHSWEENTGSGKLVSDHMPQFGVWLVALRILFLYFILMCY